MSWSTWETYFQDNFDTALPKAESDPSQDDPVLAAALVRTFSIFQLGETGEGRIAHEIAKFTPSTIDESWRAGVRMWVREEGRILRHHRAIPAGGRWSSGARVHRR